MKVASADNSTEKLSKSFEAVLHKTAHLNKCYGLNICVLLKCQILIEDLIPSVMVFGRGGAL